MKNRIISSVLTGALVLSALAAGPASASLPKGAAAPQVSTTGALAGKAFTFNLANALKKGPVVLYFFPKAFTQGCTLEARAFAEAMPQFKAAGAQVVGMSADDVETLKAASYPGGSTVGDKLTDNVATIGENQQIRRMKTVSVNNGVVVPYMHNAVAPNLGKIGVLVALESEADKDTLEALGKQIAMHIAAAFPQALTADGLDAEVIERERAIAKEKAAESGKPEAVQEKMVEGAIGKYAKENALLSQVFVMDNKTPIAQVVEQAGKDVGAKVELVDYVRFQLGEGIEKEESDFAAEVAAAAAG